jgi:hypothetical protein
MGKLSFKQFLKLFETQFAHFVFFISEMIALDSWNCSFTLHESNWLKQVSTPCAVKFQNLKCCVSSVISQSVSQSGTPTGCAETKLTQRSAVRIDNSSGLRPKFQMTPLRYGIPRVSHTSPPLSSTVSQFSPIHTLTRYLFLFTSRFRLTEDIRPCSYIWTINL